MMNKLVDEEGNILVEGIMDSVAPVTPEEEAKYHNIGRKTLSLPLVPEVELKIMKQKSLSGFTVLEVDPTFLIFFVLIRVQS